MPNDLTPSDPTRFNLNSFADLLPVREHIIGEDLGLFDGFHDGMMRSLTPVTPYEGVIAENLIAIEWEMVQHRRIRDASLRRIIKEAIHQAVVAREEAAHEDALDQAYDKFIEAGGLEEDWAETVAFDEAAAEATGHALAKRAVSRDPAEFTAACDEIEAMGLDVIDLMGEAYRSTGTGVRSHDNKLQELERRRREVKRDFDALQKARPVEAEVIEGCAQKE